MCIQWKICMRISAVALAACFCAGPQALAQKAPSYKFDPDWPKVPLPNKWWMMGVTGMYVDKDDHIWVLTRPKDINNTQSFAALNPPSAECCIAPPAIIEFDIPSLLVGVPIYCRPSLQSCSRWYLTAWRRRKCSCKCCWSSVPRPVAAGDAWHGCTGV